MPKHYTNIQPAETVDMLLNDTATFSAAYGSEPSAALPADPQQLKSCAPGTYLAVYWTRYAREFYGTLLSISMHDGQEFINISYDNGQCVSHKFADFIDFRILHKIALDIQPQIQLQPMVPAVNPVAINNVADIDRQIQEMQQLLASLENKKKAVNAETLVAEKVKTLENMRQQQLVLQQQMRSDLQNLLGLRDEFNTMVQEIADMIKPESLEVYFKRHPLLATSLDAIAQTQEEGKKIEQLWPTVMQPFIVGAQTQAVVLFSPAATSSSSAATTSQANTKRAKYI